ncbi:hypothetical protein CSIRO_1770 [Bradyrhizobiaceae bacterium SG-6C]|nr:hypothetical protein CSIRO_1770 [Bradyrhizobiaceae bacterium SG-6C]
MQPTAGPTGVALAGATMIAFQVLVAALIMAALCVMTINDVRRHG